MQALIEQRSLPNLRDGQTSQQRGMEVGPRPDYQPLIREDGTTRQMRVCSKQCGWLSAGDTVPSPESYKTRLQLVLCSGETVEGTFARS